LENRTARNSVLRQSRPMVDDDQAAAAPETEDERQMVELIVSQLETAVRMAEAEGFIMEKMLGDGSCLYRSISTGLRGTQEFHEEMRQLVVDEMNQSQAEGLYDDIARIDAANPTGWAGPEHMRALCDRLKIAIRVFDGTRSKTWTVQPRMCQAERTVNITFDGVHFNFLRKANEVCEETNTVQKTHTGVVQQVAGAKRPRDEENAIANLLVDLCRTPSSTLSETTSNNTSGSVDLDDKDAAELVAGMINGPFPSEQGGQPGEYAPVGHPANETDEALEQLSIDLSHEGFREHILQNAGFEQTIKQRPQTTKSGKPMIDRYFFHDAIPTDRPMRSNINVADAILEYQKEFSPKTINLAQHYRDSTYMKSLKATILDRERRRRIQNRQRMQKEKATQLQQKRDRKAAQLQQKRDRKAEEKKEKRRIEALQRQQERDRKAEEKKEKRRIEALQKQKKDRQIKQKKHLAEQEEARRIVMREFLLDPDRSYLPPLCNIFAPDMRKLQLRNMKTDADLGKLNGKCADGKVIHFPPGFNEKGRHVAYLEHDETMGTYLIRYVNGEVAEVEKEKLGTVFEILDATKVHHLLPPNLFEGCADLRKHPLYLKASLTFPLTLEVHGSVGLTREQIKDILSKDQYKIENLESNEAQQNMLLEELQIDPNWEKNRVDAALRKFTPLIHPDLHGSEYKAATQLLNAFRELLERVSQ